jgi:hypothetical protein
MPTLTPMVRMVHGSLTIVSHRCNDDGDGKKSATIISCPTFPSTSPDVQTFVIEIEVGPRYLKRLRHSLAGRSVN